MVHSIEHPECGISALLSSHKRADIKRNRAVLKFISRAILCSGKQCIARRGDEESLSSPRNPGNFLALLKLLALHNDTLKSDMESPAMRNATNMSP